MHDVIVLDVPDKRGRHNVRIAGEIHAGAGHALDTIDKRIHLGDRHRHTRKGGLQLRPSGAPRPENREQAGGHHERNPATVVYLRDVAREEREIHQQQHAE